MKPFVCCDAVVKTKREAPVLVNAWKFSSHRAAPGLVLSADLKSFSVPCLGRPHVVRRCAGKCVRGLRFRRRATFLGGKPGHDEATDDGVDLQDDAGWPDVEAVSIGANLQFDICIILGTRGSMFIQLPFRFSCSVAVSLSFGHSAF